MISGRLYEAWPVICLGIIWYLQLCSVKGLPSQELKWVIVYTALHGLSLRLSQILPKPWFLLCPLQLLSLSPPPNTLTSLTHPYWGKCHLWFSNSMGNFLWHCIWFISYSAYYMLPWCYRLMWCLLIIYGNSDFFKGMNWVLIYFSECSHLNCH